MPVMSPAQALERRQAMVDMTRKIMRPGVDFGAIPGTGTKPTLLKAGAEKLVSFFGLTPKMDLVETVADWTGKDHGGRPLLMYRYRVSLYRGDVLISEAEGSCNSWESRYMWRKAERQCPECQAAAIIKGRAEYGGGWVCFKKRGGCGAKFQTGDTRIESQEVGRVQNPDLYDQVNTIGKIAHKRALVAAVLLATNASEFFAANMDDEQSEGSTSDDDVIRVDGSGEPDLHHTPTFQATWLAEMQLRGFTFEHAGQILEDSLKKSKLTIERAGFQWRTGAMSAVRAGRFDRLLPETLQHSSTSAVGESGDQQFPEDDAAPPSDDDAIKTWDGFLNVAFAAATGQADATVFDAGINAALLASGMKGKGPKTRVEWRREILVAIRAKAFEFATGKINQVQVVLEGERA